MMDKLPMLSTQQSGKIRWMELHIKADNCKSLSKWRDVCRRVDREEVMHQLRVKGCMGNASDILSAHNGFKLFIVDC